MIRLLVLLNDFATMSKMPKLAGPARLQANADLVEGALSL